jgi:hypothetical protein
MYIYIYVVSVSKLWSLYNLLWLKCQPTFELQVGSKKFRKRNPVNNHGFYRPCYNYNEFIRYLHFLK